jgi:hypothetical protein
MTKKAHRTLRSRDGFALPAAIFALALVAVLVTGGFYMGSQEFRMGQSAERTAQARILAETGMNEVLGTWSPALNPTTVWGASVSDCVACSGQQGDGRWQVAITRVDDLLFYIESAGVVDQGGRLAGGSRSMGIMARLMTADFPTDSALRTRGNVRTTGSAQIRGEDLNPGGWGDVCDDPGPNKPGVITSPGATVESEGSSVISGDPPYTFEETTEDDFLQFGDLSWDDLVAMADIRLPGGTYNGTGPVFNADGTCDRSAPLNWGDPDDPSSACGNYFPIIHIDGNALVQSGGRGQGILLVEGDLDLRGDFLFTGIIIAQGSLEVQGGGAGGPRISGAAMAANADLDLQSYVGSSIIRFSGCAIERTLANINGLAWLRPLASRSWVDLTAIGF